MMTTHSQDRKVLGEAPLLFRLPLDKFLSIRASHLTHQMVLVRRGNPGMAGRPQSISISSLECFGSRFIIRLIYLVTYFHLFSSGLPLLQNPKPSVKD
jgi:hypothetical protein